MHFSAGAPARGSKITSILCENGKDSNSYRGVFIHNRLVAFVTTYYKGYSKSKRVKTIYQFVPRKVSELVICFLTLTQPFIIDVQKVQYSIRSSTPFI